MSGDHPTTDEQAAYTPGPWCIVGRDTALEVVEAKRNWMRVCFLTSDGACEANARLIAAAPDLLALAKQYLSECSECNGSGTTWDRDNCTHTIDCPDCADIRAVIAKAEGKAHV